MSIITVCKPFEVTGGADPQSFAISIAINSDSPNTSGLTAYYTINGGAQMGAQTFPATGAVSGQTYTATASGVVTGDVVRVCVDADILTVENDTGLVDFAGTAAQTAADGCEITHTIDAACNWTAIAEFLAPDCSVIPGSINCDDLPYTLPVIPNAVSTSVSITGTDYIYSSGSIVQTAAGGGGSAIVTIIAIGGSAEQDCTAMMEILECATDGTSQTQFVYDDCFGQTTIALLVETTTNGVTTYMLDTPSTSSPIRFISTCGGDDTVSGGNLSQIIYNQLVLHVNCADGFTAEEQGC